MSANKGPVATAPPSATSTGGAATAAAAAAAMSVAAYVPAKSTYVSREEREAAAKAKKAKRIARKKLKLELTRFMAVAHLAEANAQARLAAEAAKTELIRAKEKEHEKALALEEEKRLVAEDLQYSQELAREKAETARWEQRFAHEISWKRYVECNPLPDVSSEATLNTFLSQWSEPDSVDGGLKGDRDFSVPPHKALQPTVDACHRAELVLDEMRDAVVSDAELMKGYRDTWVQEFEGAVRDASRTKLDQLTAHFLFSADKYEDEATRIFIACAAAPKVSLGICVHMSANAQRMKTVPFDAISINIALPVSLQKNRTCIRVIRTMYDHVSTKPKLGVLPLKLDGQQGGKREDRKKNKGGSKENSSSSVGYVAVGGVVHIQRLELPAPAKKVMDWTIRNMTDTSGSKLVETPYPSDEEQVGSLAPLRITYRFDQNMYFQDTSLPVFAWWDDKHACWQTNGVQAVKYVAEYGVCHLELSVLKPFAVVQPRAIDFPYRNFSLLVQDGAEDDKDGSERMVQRGSSNLVEDGNGGGGDDDGRSKKQLELSDTTARAFATALRLEGSRFTACIEAVDTDVRLVNPSDGCLTEFVGELMRPGILLLRLKRCGINLMPSDDDAIFCRKPRKQHDLELKLHSEVSSLAGLFDIEGSRWSSGRGSDVALFRVRLAQVCTMTEQGVAHRAKYLAAVEQWNKSDDEDEDASDDEGDVTATARDETAASMSGADDSGSEESDDEDDEDEKEAEEDSEVRRMLQGAGGGSGSGDEANDGGGVYEQGTAQLEDAALIKVPTSEWVTVMLKNDLFVVVNCTETKFSDEPVPGAVPHRTLRRTLAAHYAPVTATLVSLKQSFDFSDWKLMGLQRSVYRLLNMSRPFVFY